MKQQVLFVDDDPSILRAMQRVMRTLQDDLDMEFKASSKEALQVMEHRRFNIVICDMRMPGMDGPDFLGEVKARFPEVVRIVLSGHSDDSMVFRALESTHQYLAKPCSAETVKQTIHRACEMQALLTDENLKRVVTGVNRLPSLPKIYAQLVEELREDRCDLERVGEIIAQDSALSIKILQLVNSAFFGLSRPISNPAEAANHLGLDTVKTLALVVEVFEAFSIDHVSTFSMDAYWKHCLRVGFLAGAIAKHEGGDLLLQDQSKMGGMLHDVGKLILASFVPEEYQRIQEVVMAESVPEWQAEEQILGTTHARICGYLLGTWGLPMGIVESVLYHHQLDQLSVETFSPPIAVHVANALTHEEDGVSPQDHKLDEETLGRMGLLMKLDDWRGLVQKPLTE
ncbi:MAG: response regulator [Nitrospirales bacterium]|nr:HDOD domain-containing protein [Nitrospira sp.]MDR4501496.1 response regulator [Nitrospirales bacterium]